MPAIMNQPPDSTPSTGPERRGGDREPTCESATLMPSAGSLGVSVENVSRGGLFAVLQGALELEIKLQGEAEPRRIRLVRSHLLPGGKTGFGFQFVESDGSPDTGDPGDQR